jgi:hypothetical protein
MNTLKVGIANLEQYKARTMAIARGQYVPGPNEPKVWFQSLENFARAFGQEPCVADSDRADRADLAPRACREDRPRRI